MKLKLKLFKKYFFLTATIVALSLTFMLTILSFFINNYLAKEKHQTLKECCNSISDFTSSRKLDSDSLITVMGYVTPTLTKTIDAQILVTDTAGSPIYCSCAIYKQDHSCEHTKAAIDSKIVQKTLQVDEYYEVGRLGNLLNSPSYIYGTGLQDNNGTTYALIFAYSQASTIRYFFMNIVRMFLMASLVTLVVMFLAVYFVTYRMTKPLVLMSEAAGCMANGDFSRRIPVTGDDEVSDLARAFNNMTDSLVQLESTRRSFVANVSHELKTPMTTIGGFIDGIIDGTIPENQQKQYLQIVSDEVKRLSRLVQSMLSLSKLESGEMKINLKEVDLSAVIIDIVLAQSQRIESRNLEIKGLDTLPQLTVKADRDLIHQVLYNLVDNAVKFTNVGGEISFKMYRNERGHTHFIIRNSGTGIEAKDLPHIFERFYKTDRSRSAVRDSTGLGLYIVKTIIDIHHGQITVRSQPNRYTEFDFYIPQL